MEADDGGSSKKRQVTTGGGAGVDDDVVVVDRVWAELNPDIVRRVARLCHLSLGEYPVLRGVCAPWRSALPLLSPMFIYTDASVFHVTDGGGRAYQQGGGFVSTFSLTMETSLELRGNVERLVTANVCKQRVGSSGGWLAVQEERHELGLQWIIVHPISGKKILLPEWTGGNRWVGKMVFSPNPSAADFTAAAICDYHRIVYAMSGYDHWSVVGLDGRLNGYDKLCDVLYHEGDGKIYCVTKMGQVFVVTLRVHGTIRTRMVENLPPQAGKFEPDSVFPPPYSTLYNHTATKHLVFCEGNLYQVWRNSICTVTSMPAPLDGRRHRVVTNDMFVLRYDPGRGDQACWSEASDLGGHAVFVGRNNAVSVRAAGGVLPRVRPDCVYWICGNDGLAMEFDMATKTSKPCVQGAAGGEELLRRHRALCWYFLVD
ncbi:hypothetical protein GUJ93_ZPchr0005g14354 [Zizania palustris]|uniref:KIB1-4 beta-propeller domain-containing protein n=1 Tax=Zizania palustris TaxID=103762 RepID=A0A8J5SL07_ZIZPA|nr:hypothetical protein GUJ93_ZPchr0005g14354 [Zizania palustris]